MSSADTQRDLIDAEVSSVVAAVTLTAANGSVNAGGLLVTHQVTPGASL